MALIAISYVDKNVSIVNLNVEVSAYLDSTTSLVGLLSKSTHVPRPDGGG